MLHSELAFGIFEIRGRDDAFGLGAVVDQDKVAGYADNGTLTGLCAGTAFSSPFALTFACRPARFTVGTFKFFKDIGERHVRLFVTLFSSIVLGHPTSLIYSGLGPPEIFNHSYRRARIGSTLVARRAGIKLAIKAMDASTIDMTINVVGSSGDT